MAWYNWVGQLLTNPLNCQLRGDTTTSFGVKHELNELVHNFSLFTLIRPLAFASMPYLVELGSCELYTYYNPGCILIPVS